MYVYIYDAGCDPRVKFLGEGENFASNLRDAACNRNTWGVMGSAKTAQMLGRDPKPMLLKPTSNPPILLLLLCDITYRDVKLLRRLKSVQLGTFPISKLGNQSVIKLLEEDSMV